MIKHSLPTLFSYHLLTAHACLVLGGKVDIFNKFTGIIIRVMSKKVMGLFTPLHFIFNYLDNKVITF